MVSIEAEVKKWGNSFAIIIPSEVVEKENIREKQKIRLLLMRRRESIHALKETFGMLKGKLTKTGQQFKDEARRELYN